MPGMSDLVSTPDAGVEGASGLGSVAQGAMAAPGMAEKHLGFLQAGNEQAITGVESSAAAGVQVAGKATDMAISVAKLGIDAATKAVKIGVAVVCTAVGAPEAADAINKPIDMASGVVDKGIEKAQESAHVGEAAIKG